ncbi:amino acid adenylation domain-containing protein [Catellatospora vulcania]|uniref:amino acid adenylation domain-containing protein n=1 Tax=Catellatospora vulcania TaxID=1460450 RepID=UPI0012D3D7CE|nr:amino acid adenylation domain-containing protein [Catellatospora vulcania]
MFSGKTLHELFAAQAARTGDRVAVTDGVRSLTYRQLDERANGVAVRLVELGTALDDMVGLCAERGIDMIVGMLGILKAGAAYVPVDPGYPADRVAFLLRDSGVTTVVATTAVADRLTAPDTRVLLVDRDTTPVPAVPPVAASEDNLAYVIYTSGSTGTPKGVLIEHRNAVKLFEQTTDLVGFRDDDVWTLFHSLSFDFSVWEVWGALLFGGRLVVVDTDTARSPALLRKLLVDQRVTVLNQTPSAFRRLVAEELTHPEGRLALRLVIFGGERLDVKALEPWFARYPDNPVLINMYGITETTVHVTHRRITGADLDEPGASPIGDALPEYGIHLLDSAGQPVADGGVGEMYVGGTGVARGYHQRPELTAERFTTLGDARVYRSGDLARRTADGGYVYLGRADDQIKIRGFRVEPFEIEALLVDDPRVASAIVAPEDFGDGDVRLLAHLVAAPGREIPDGELATLVADLSARCAATLPEHMRPSRYRLIAEVPLTPQGKVDREALRGLAYREAPADSPQAAGLTATQALVTEIVTEVLARGGIGLDDDLFDCGATSLAFMRIIASVNQRCHTSLTGAELDEATVACLAACIDEQA